MIVIRSSSRNHALVREAFDRLRNPLRTTSASIRMAAVTFASAVIAFARKTSFTTAFAPTVALSWNLSDLKKSLSFKLGRDDALEAFAGIESGSHLSRTCSSDGWMAAEARRVVREFAGTAESGEVVAFEAAVSFVYRNEF
jgi:hypothetical protein